LHLGLDCVFAVGNFLFSMQRYPTRRTHTGRVKNTMNGTNKCGYMLYVLKKSLRCIVGDAVDQYGKASARLSGANLTT
jgi:hypothetical protein